MPFESLAAAAGASSSGRLRAAIPKASESTEVNSRGSSKAFTVYHIRPVVALGRRLACFPGAGCALCTWCTQALHQAV